MPETVAVSTKPVEVEIAKELVGKSVLLHVKGGDLKVDVYNNLQLEKKLQYVNPGGTARLFAPEKITVVAQGDSNLLICR